MMYKIDQLKKPGVAQYPTLSEILLSNHVLQQSTQQMYFSFFPLDRVLGTSEQHKQKEIYFLKLRHTFFKVRFK